MAKVTIQGRRNTSAEIAVEVSVKGYSTTPCSYYTLGYVPWRYHSDQMSAFGYDNKSAESNLGRGPRRGGVAHVRRKVLIGYSGAPQNRPKSTTSRGPIPKPQYLPHPWTRPTYGAKRHRDPIRRFPQYTGQTDAQTDRSSTGTFDDYSPLRL